MAAGNPISDSRRAFLAASPRLFRNPLLDRLSRVHPMLPPVLYLPVILGLLYVSRRFVFVGTMVAEFVGGYVLWTVIEYFGHRFLFHHRFASPPGRWAQFLMHGVHHDHPNDPLRLVMPPLMSVPIMEAAWAVLKDRQTTALLVIHHDRIVFAETNAPTRQRAVAFWKMLCEDSGVHIGMLDRPGVAFHGGFHETLHQIWLARNRLIGGDVGESHER